MLLRPSDRLEPSTPSLPFSDKGRKRGDERVIAARKARKSKGSDEEK
jgi:hypothetical protein